MSYTLYTNGHVVSMDKQDTIAESVLVKDGLIEAVGSDKDLRKIAPADVRIIDLKGMPLYPGFIDSHSHFGSTAATSFFYSCGGMSNLEELFSVLKKEEKKLAKPEYPIFVYNFDDTDISDMRGPSRKELDAVCSHRAVMVLHISGHAAYANTKAFERLGIDCSKTRNPTDDVEIFLDEQGLPEGKITENAVMKLIMSFLPSPLDPKMVKERLLDTIAMYNSQGFTSLQDGGLGPDEQSPYLVYQVLQELKSEGKLALRIYLNFFNHNPKILKDMEEKGILKPTSDDRFIQPMGIKMVTDGSIQAYTGYFPVGYYDHPEITSNLIHTQEYWEKEIELWHSKGYQISMHGNGTGAIEMIITAVEKAQAKFPRKDLRHIIIHCQTVTEEQLVRMKKVNLLPSFFGLHVWNWGDRHHDMFLGPERAARMNPCASALKLGIPFGLHADTPVLPQMTMRSIHTAVNRETKKGMILGADQKISTKEAVKAYTTYSAYFSYSEDWRGSIEAGKVADFIIPSQDILSCDPSKLKDITFTATIVDNKLVYGNLP